MTLGRVSRRFIALVVVVALHCLFLLLLLARGRVTPTIVYDEPTSVLFFIERPQPTLPTAPPPVQSSRPRAQPRVVAEQNAPEQPSTPPTAPSNPSAPIDWTAQAAESAAAVVDKAIQAETRKCDPSDSPQSFLPPCQHRTKKFEWNPNASRFGFSGGLPFVRVGERCAIGLGFFGCGFGAKPPANGDLFEGMDDPERDRSSVPSPNP